LVVFFNLISSRAFEMCDVLPTSTDVRIDDKDLARFTYSPPGVWRQFDNKRFTDGSQHLTQTVDGQFTIKFNGSHVWYASDKDTLHGTFRVNIDGVLETGSSQNNGYIDEAYLWCKELVPGEHTLTVTNLDKDKYLTVDYIAYRPISGEMSISQSQDFPGTSSTSDPTTAMVPSPSPSEGAASQNNGISTGSYVGIIMGTIALILLAVLAFLVVRDRRRRAADREVVHVYAPSGMLETGIEPRPHDPSPWSSFASRPEPDRV
jgi:hypothetical protein